MTSPTDDRDNTDNTLSDADQFAPPDCSQPKDAAEPRRYQPTRKAREMFEDVDIRGMTIDEVTAKWNTSPRTVYDVIERVRSYMRTNFRQKLADPQWLAIHQLWRLEYQWQEAMRAWNYSQLDRRALQEMLDQTESAIGLVEQECRTRVGDVRFLQLGHRLMADVRTLMGEVHNVFLQPGDQDDDNTLTVEQRREEIHRIVGQVGQRGGSETDAAAAGGDGSGDLD